MPDNCTISARPGVLIRAIGTLAGTLADTQFLNINVLAGTNGSNYGFVDQAMSLK